ncbi:hypothetical protein B0T16DRAFT_505537 [Cercophora newfieldiana]|uniref:NADH:flavin oxidoreductase/NADH oxidase N-terminal domain-containing protein n=1 Tax=Cercophora newfieldiana TaxID=92897 RepID=A0AA40CXG6_9PEZI|nr:hypothetical protein B0T16DRAFT_505537 [Cercophora newfieldiana]
MTSPNLQIAQPLTLPCGLTLPNRLIKASMSEEMGGPHTRLPSPSLCAVYRHWAAGHWGAVLTGAVHISPSHLSSPTSLAIDSSLPTSTTVSALSEWAVACKGPGGTTPAIIQLNHPGRQTPFLSGTRGVFEKPVAPSAVALSLGSGLIARVAGWIAFGVPRAMNQADIDQVVREFASAADLAARAGFDGVEVHAAHGYLLSQFLSGGSNVRGDRYGGSAGNRARVVAEVVKAIREATGWKGGFAVGVKVNSVDYQHGGGELEEGLEQVAVIVKAGVDFIEVSGGSYEDPTMNTGPAGGEEGQEEGRSDRTRRREAFFLEFARAIRERFPEVPLIVTGGFRSRTGMEEAVASGDCDMVGLARAAVLNPLLPETVVFNKEVKDEDAKLYVRRLKTPWWLRFLGIRAIGVGVESLWYASKIKALAKLAPAS